MHFWIFLESFYTPLAADPIPPYPSSLLPWELIHLSHCFNTVTSSFGYIDPISWIWSFMWPLPCWHPLNHPLCHLIFLSAPHMSYFSTTWWLHTVSTFRSFFPPAFLVYYHILWDLSFCVFVSLQGCFFLIREHRSSDKWWFCVLSSLCSRILLSLC